jgi:hypothetical protein
MLEVKDERGEEGLSTDESESTHSMASITTKKSREKSKKESKEIHRDRTQWEKELTERYFFLYYGIH